MPPAITVSVTDRSLTLASDGAIVSTAVICPGYAFDSFGSGGPHFSPDQHWILVDIRGPFAPGSVPRNHALVNVRTGTVVASPDFPTMLEIPSAPDGVNWESGERSTLRYANGKTAALRDPMRKSVAKLVCAPAARAA